MRNSAFCHLCRELFTVLPLVRALAFITQVGGLRPWAVELLRQAVLVAKGQ
jgi:hypothetical protein